LFGLPLWPHRRAAQTTGGRDGQRATRERPFRGNAHVAVSASRFRGKPGFRGQPVPDRCDSMPSEPRRGRRPPGSPARLWAEGIGAAAQGRGRVGKRSPKLVLSCSTVRPLHVGIELGIAIVLSTLPGGNGARSAAGPLSISGPLLCGEAWPIRAAGSLRPVRFRTPRTFPARAAPFNRSRGPPPASSFKRPRLLREQARDRLDTSRSASAQGRNVQGARREFEAVG